MIQTVFLVSCCAAKAGGRGPDGLLIEHRAKDLYVSDWFLKARAYVESTGCQWRILSALCGLVSPEHLMLPYDFTFDPKDPNDLIRRKTWGNTVAQNLRCQFNPGLTRFVIFAGAAYREFLTTALSCHGFANDAPMSHMGIGQQKKWFMERTADLAWAKAVRAS